MRTIETPRASANPSQMPVAAAIALMLCLPGLAAADPAKKCKEDIE